MENFHVLLCLVKKHHNRLYQNQNKLTVLLTTFEVSTLKKLTADVWVPVFVVTKTINFTDQLMIRNGYS